MSQLHTEEPYDVSGFSKQSTDNTKGTISLIAGIICLLLGLISICVIGPCAMVFTVIGAFLGLILGYQARREMAQSVGIHDNEAIVTAGIVLGWVNAALSILYLLLFILGVASLGLLFWGDIF